jgi:hypothetical protein
VQAELRQCIGTRVSTQTVRACKPDAAVGSQPSIGYSTTYHSIVDVEREKQIADAVSMVLHVWPLSAGLIW